VGSAGFAYLFRGTLQVLVGSTSSSLPVGRLEESSEVRCVGSEGFAYLFSGRNSGISGSALSNFVKVAKATQNGVRIVFEGAKAAGEPQAGSTAASSFTPEPARSGCFETLAL
jgi:hypothetical protein